MSEQALYDRLLGYAKENYYPFHMPGHKRNTDILSMINPYAIDITEIEGFDNLHSPNDVILNLMNKISLIYKSSSSYILVNGSTCGILAAVSATTLEGDKIAIARNCHKSVYNAVFLRNLKCHYIMPAKNNYGIFEDINAEAVEELLQKNPGIKAVVITSPTYEGIVSDIKSISEIVHKYNATLIVDEAHGAHFIFDDYFPKSAIELGADIVIQSLHKTLPAMTQTAILHIAGNRVDKHRVEKYIGIYESSSPSYILMSSVGKCMDILEKQGKKLFKGYIQRLEKIYDKCSNMNWLFVFMPENVFDFDKGKINIISRDKGYTGVDLYNELLNKYHLQMEMASCQYVIAMTSICDTDEGIDRLIDALKDIDSRLTEEKGSNCNKNDIGYIEENRNIVIPKKILESYETDMEEKEEVLFDHSEGRISGEFIYLYPPGCPILVPGELITKELIENVNNYIKEGLNITGLNKNKIIVVNNKKIK